MKVQPLRLPDADPSRLSEPPLTLAIAQVRHERRFEAALPATGLGIRQALGPEAGTLSESRQHVMTLMAGPGTPTAETAEGQTGWQIASDAATVSIQHEFFSLETAAYTTWEEFRERLSLLAEAVQKQIRPTVEQRIGLRYVNTVVHPRVSTPTGWEGLIDADLLGCLAHGPLKGSIRSSQQVLELEGPADIRTNLRHGSQVAPTGGRPTYVLDLDCYTSAGRAFRASDILATFDKLHEAALQLFQSCVTPKLRDHWSAK